MRTQVNTTKNNSKTNNQQKLGKTYAKRPHGYKITINDNK